MDDPNAPPIAPSPPEPPAPPQDALDPDGVPWKNRVSEWQRKAQEAEALVENYKVALGAQTQQRQTAPPAPVPDNLDELEKQFDEPTRRYIDQKIRRVAQEVAEQTGYKFVSQAGVQNELQADPEIAQEAQKQYQALATNPLWARADDVLKQEHAVTAAKAVVNARRMSKGRETQTEEARREAERALANGASLPGTRGASPPQPKTKEEYIKTFMADAQNVADFRTAYGRKLDPFSAEGQKAFREAAEIAYDVGPKGMWGGKTAVATRILEEENRQ